MKIPNYDTNTNPTTKRRLNNFGLDEDFRMLIAGQSGCGKTNTLMHLLRTPLVFYDKIYIFSPNLHQDKLMEFKKLMNEILKKLVIQSWKWEAKPVSQTQMNIHSTTEKWLYLMILSMPMQKFTTKLPIISPMEGIMVFPRFI